MIPPPSASLAAAPGTDRPEAPAPLDPSLLRRLREVVGERGLLVDPSRLLVYESDGLTQYRVPPSAVVLPARAEEMRRVLRLLHEAGVPVVPRGAGTGLSGGALATRGGVIVGTSRMTRILEVDPVNRRARVEPGVVNARLTQATLPHGLIYAPDPSSQSACTLGGNVAENSGGPHCLKYGVTSRYVEALTLVLADGSQVVLGGADGAGEPDLAGLVCGSEGCFGIVVEIEVGLVPAPPAVRTLLGLFDTVEDAGRAVTRLMAQGLLPAALEIIDQETIRAVEASVFAAGFPLDAGAALVVEFDGVEAGLDEEADLAREACLAEGAREVRVAAGGEERDALWRGRKKAFGAMGRIAPDLLVQDATVPRSRLPEVLGRIAEIGRAHDLVVANVFHAGDGNLHPNLLFDRRDPEQVARVEAASKAIMNVCIEAGGTITGEHGVGIDKRAYLPLVCPPEVLRAMGEVRRAFDPEGRMNPGKVLPDGWGPPDPPTPLAPPVPIPPTGPERGALADGVLEHAPDDLVVRVTGGCTLETLQRVVGARGQWFPADPPGGGACTVADLLLEGRNGPLAGGYGRVRDHLLGVVLCVPSGHRLSLGGRVVKNVAGFDLVRLVVGSRGRLGRIEEATLRLFPLPAADRTVLWSVPFGGDPGDAGNDRLVADSGDLGAWALASELRRAGFPLGALAALAWFGGPGHGRGVLAARLTGSEAVVDHLVARLHTLLPPPARAPLEGAESRGWWALRSEEAGFDRGVGTAGAKGGAGPARRRQGWTAGAFSQAPALLAALSALPDALRPGGAPGPGVEDEPVLTVHLLDAGPVERVVVSWEAEGAGSETGVGTGTRARVAEAIRQGGGKLVLEGEPDPEPGPGAESRRALLDRIAAAFPGAA